MRKFIIVYPNRDYGKLMWKDIESNENVIIIDRALHNANKVSELIFKIHFSFYINNKVMLPFKSIWKHKYLLSNIEYRPEDEYVIVMTDPALCNYTADYLEWLRKRYNVKLVLLMINSFYRMEKIISPMISVFDRVFTFDKEEAEKFDFEYYSTIYSMVDVEFENDGKSDIGCFFVGVAKDRLKKILTVYDYLEANGVCCKFYIAGVKKNERIEKRGIVYNQWLSYKEVLKFVKSTRSILEIMDKNSAGITLRTLEAFCYNKRLITDNEKIKDNPFYDSNSVFLLNYDCLDGLGEFVKNQSEVNYKYDGRYSPKYFIEKLDKMFG